LYPEPWPAIHVRIASFGLKARDPEVVFRVEEYHDSVPRISATAAIGYRSDEVEGPGAFDVCLHEIHAGTRIQNRFAKTFEVLVWRRILGPLKVVFDLFRVLFTDPGGWPRWQNLAGKVPAEKIEV
jgi:hypothetical protein